MPRFFRVLNIDKDKTQKKLFVFLSFFYVVFYSVKNIVVNFLHVFFKIDNENIDNHKHEKKIICDNFPYYSFLLQLSEQDDIKPCLSLGNYLIEF